VTVETLTPTKYIKNSGLCYLEDFDSIPVFSLQEHANRSPN